MNKSNLIKRLFSGKDLLSEEDLEKSTNIILNFISETLHNGDRVEIRNCLLYTSDAADES